MRSAAFFALLTAAAPAYSALFQQPEQLKTLEYDYVVIGGGTAGNVVANRLSANPNVSVLVLEAGVSNENVLGTQIPLFGPTLAPYTAYDWNYTTVPMPGLNGRTIPYPRGFILGGSSSINYLVYNRGSRDDFDSYARIAGSKDWSWDSILKNQAPKNEHFVPPNDGHNITGQYLPSAHFTTGEVDVSLPGYAWPLDQHVLAITKEFPEDFPYQPDVNAGNMIGISWAQAAVGYGLRSSSATAYLAPKYVTRPNLSVLLHARVTKIVKTGTQNGKPLFGAVDFAVTSSSKPIRVKARKEIILSAGSFNSPQLLMLSGIGDKAALGKLGIDTILNLPSVGKNGTDHVLLPNVVEVNTTETFDKYTAPDTVASSIAEWQATHKGPLSYTVTNQMGWLRLPSDDPVIKKYGDPTAGPTSAHYELIFAAGFAGNGPAPTTGRYNTVYTNLISPTSRGTVTLNTSNPFDAPIINPNFLATETDIHIVVKALQSMKKIVESKSWKGYFLGYQGSLAKVKTEADMITYARENAGSVWHFVGTAAMSGKGAKYGVVDPDFRVKGAAGLRVVDASVIPYVPCAHTHAPVYLVAELASDMILS